MRRLILSLTLAAMLMPAKAASAWPGRPSDPPTSGDSEQSWYNKDHAFHYRDSDRNTYRWVPLSRFTPARQGRETVSLVGQARRIDRVKINAVRGAPKIQRVIIEYADKSVERLPVRTQMQPGQTQIIALDAERRPARITVVTDPRYGGAYSLYGG